MVAEFAAHDQLAVSEERVVRAVHRDEHSCVDINIDYFRQGSF